MKFISLIFTALILTSYAHAAKPSSASTSGMVYICSDASGELKMTADLVSNPGDKLTVVAEIGSRVVFTEGLGKKRKHAFILHPAKDSFFEIRKVGPKGTAKTAVLSLTVNPQKPDQVVAQDHEDTKITRLDAILNAPSLNLYHEPVSCLQTAWK